MESKTDVKTKSRGKDKSRKWWQTSAVFVPVSVAFFGCITALMGTALNPELAKVVIEKALLPPATPTPLVLSSASIVDASGPVFVDTPQPISAPSATLPPLPTLAETGTSNPNCSWVFFSTLAPSPSSPSCLNDFLDVGVSESGGLISFYRKIGMNPSIMGISRPVSNASELSISVKIDTLNFVRLLILVSEDAVGYKSSLGFRIVPEDGERYIQLVTYDNGGFDSRKSSTTELPLWDGKLNLRLRFDGPRVRAYVNDAYFGETQIIFSKRFLFLGYQVMQNPASPPYIDAHIQPPEN